MYKFKVVLVGDSGVGKTALFTRFQGGEFSSDFLSTVGGAFANFQIKNESDEKINIGIWDTAGQEKFRNIVPMYFQKANFVIAVYSINSQESFDNINFWVNLAKEKAPSNAKIIIIGNKSDLIDQKVVKIENALLLGEKIGAYLTIETSAKTGDGIELLLTQIGNGSSEILSNSNNLENLNHEINGFEIPDIKKEKKKCC